MKWKYFLRGLGLGILVTTLVLCISYRRQNSDNAVVDRARQLGMEFSEKTPDTLVQPSASPEAATSGAAVKGQTAVPEKIAVPTVKATGMPTANPATSPTPKVTEKVKDTKTGKVHNFTVKNGLLSSSVSREMKEAGIIKDADAFDEYLEKSGMARKVLAGKYKIPVGASYEEIAKIITKTK